MAIEFLVNRFKALVVFLLGVFRRAMCCFRRRRRSSCDSIPLSAIGVVPNTLNITQPELEHWDQWEENPVVIVPDRPVDTIQAKIEQYRQQASKPPESTEEQQPDFFENMTPKITTQTKILIKDKSLENTSWNSTKFAVINDPIPSNELGEWEDNAVGWEEETTKEFGDPTKTLREQKRKEREQRLFEQQQKRIERSSRPQPLGAKLNS
ncbi:receptor-binding cancer antigen protein expressed on SiSo cells [Apis mellifera carnica]|uniref:Receptor-binding cancer antigen expressed on SiSo cells n=1 Tax=Apis mellifera TaxID=7460 RepID=A0A7M7FYY6_APIME|nr:receptor-binding cancer antigen expressed on SiSo cells [Apis mellifera]KAG9433540.1 receptor-binding cancer antigen protein expressed on SiSo cells [Apis mellifera carnica]|eukprot:XP_001122059.2 receptor-binding cancer antigen expressed on SiSo cells [Apis mellifera]